MKYNWKLKDILDLEYFNTLDGSSEELSENDFHQRERQIFLETFGEKSPENSHLECLLAWLIKRRGTINNLPDTFQPGATLQNSLHLFSLILLISGLLIGVFSGLSFFVYTGETPLNVFTFFFIFILPQLILVAIFVLRSLLLRLFSKPISNFTDFILPAFVKFFSLTKKGILNRKNPKAGEYFQRFILQMDKTLLFVPLFLATQLFGIFFNIGLIAVTLSKIVTTDLAFGWQTTLQVGSEKLYALTKLLALPWSWFLPPNLASPTLEQIEGSRIILKDGIVNLATENLISWWPFLLLCLVCYGLLPRLILFLMGKFIGYQFINRFILRNKFRTISERMRTPLVSTQAAPETLIDAIPQDTQITSLSTKEGAQTDLRQAIILIADEIFDIFDQTVLTEHYAKYGYLPVEKIPIFRNYDDDRELLTRIPKMNTYIIVLLEAWMAPIHEHLMLLKNITESTKNETNIGVCLVGKVTASDPFRVPQSEDSLLWKKKISPLCKGIVFFESPEPPQTSQL